MWLKVPAQATRAGSRLHAAGDGALCDTAAVGRIVVGGASGQGGEKGPGEGDDGGELGG